MRADASSAPNGEGVLDYLRSLGGYRKAKTERPSWQTEPGSERDAFGEGNAFLSGRVIPALVLLFLVTLAASRLTLTLGDRSSYVEDAHKDLTTVTTLLSASLKLLEASGAAFDQKPFMEELAASGILPAGTLLFVTDRDGIVVATLPERAAGSVPHLFFGSATLGGASATDGTFVTAWVAEFSEPVATAVVADGQYKVSMFQYGKSSFAGRTITFKIGEADAQETGTWESFGADLLNLIAG